MIENDIKLLEHCVLDLQHRVQALENKIKQTQRRVTALECKADRKTEQTERPYDYAWDMYVDEFDDEEPSTEKCPFDDLFPCERVCTEFGKCKYKPKDEPQTEKEGKQ